MEILFDDFKRIQEGLASLMLNKVDNDANLGKIFTNLWNEIRKERKPLEEIKATLPKKNITLVFITEQCYRLFRSYRKNLSQFFTFSVQEQTNSKMEQKIGQEKMKFVQRSDKANVNRQTQVRGRNEFKLLYTGENEVYSYINALEGEYTTEEVKKGQ